jgi:ribosomal-protein-alanine N-acetyltransferase
MVAYHFRPERAEGSWTCSNGFPDPMNFSSRWPEFQALRNRIGRMLRWNAQPRISEMPVLETERLVLRKFASDDLDAVIAWEEALAARDRGEDAREFLEYCVREYRERGIGPWAMQLKESGEIAGNCGLPHIQFRKLCGEVNYYVSPKYRRQGVAAEGVQALLKFGFGELGLVRILARCDTENVSSERVMVKVGMKFERLLERSSSSKDPRPEQKLYSIQKKDFNPMATQGKKCE